MKRLRASQRSRCSRSLRCDQVVAATTVDLNKDPEDAGMGSLIGMDAVA